MSAIHLVFWGQLVALVIHIFEESSLGGGFVTKVREHWWPEYSWTKFFWFNTGFILFTVASNLLFDGLGGHWIILPLSLIIHFVFNGGFHLWWSMNFKEYSPGLLTSVNYWLLLYLVFVFGVSPGDIQTWDLINGIILGCLLGLFTSFGTIIAGKMAASKRVKAVSTSEPRKA